MYIKKSQIFTALEIWIKTETFIENIPRIHLENRLMEIARAARNFLRFRVLKNIFSKEKYENRVPNHQFSNAKSP